MFRNFNFNIMHTIRKPLNFKKKDVVGGQSYSIRECVSRVSRGLGLPSYMVKNGGAFNGQNNFSVKSLPDDLTALEYQRRKVSILHRNAIEESKAANEAAKQRAKGTQKAADTQPLEHDASSETA